MLNFQIIWDRKVSNNKSDFQGKCGVVSEMVPDRVVDTT